MRLVYVPDFAAPKGYMCNLCKRRLKRGQVALFDRDKEGEFKRSYHADCVRSLLGTEPETVIQGRSAVEKEYNRIKQSILDGKVWA